eukprot:3933110-Rhodomonas_salina.2
MPIIPTELLLLLALVDSPSSTLRLLPLKLPPPEPISELRLRALIPPSTLLRRLFFGLLVFKNLGEPPGHEAGHRIAKAQHERSAATRSSASFGTQGRFPPRHRRRRGHHHQPIRELCSTDVPRNSSSTGRCR